VHRDDVGDPVPGAHVRFAGLSKLTDASGKASFTDVTSDSLSATASKKGYADTK
jgi:hypothetical protein